MCLYFAQITIGVDLHDAKHSDEKNLKLFTFCFNTALWNFEQAEFFLLLWHLMCLVLKSLLGRSVNRGNILEHSFPNSHPEMIKSVPEGTIDELSEWINWLLICMINGRHKCHSYVQRTENEVFMKQSPIILIPDF